MDPLLDLFITDQRGDLWGTVGPSYSLSFEFFFTLPVVLLPIFTLHFSSTSSASVLFYSCCSLAQLFEKALMHELHISYSYTEKELSFSSLSEKA